MKKKKSCTNSVIRDEIINNLSSTFIIIIIIYNRLVYENKFKIYTSLVSHKLGDRIHENTNWE